MENLDVTVLRHLLQWRREGRRALLATVVRTWGSSPRPVGSIMALCENGSVVGSVSGGCIEDDLVYRYSRANTSPNGAATPGITHDIPQGPPQTVVYGVTADEAHRFGLPCGGTLELLLEFNPDPDSLDELVQALTKGRMMRRDTELSTGRVTLSPVEQPVPLVLDDLALRNSFGPEYRMLLIGAGQLTEYLATMALFCGFAVTVCDPREEYRGGWSVAGATLDSGMPDDVVRAFGMDRRSCVIALTHDPKLDDLALLEALDSEAFYVGAIGSRRNNQARRARLMEHFDVSEERLAHLHGPVGIHIGSKTPPEIAVSIMAEVLAVKNGVPPPSAMRVGHAKDAAQAPETAPVCGVGTR
ncbi:MAG: XdhC family protein [Burkholderiaceae bacterium]